jgi:hypothetical protein
MKIHEMVQKLFSRADYVPFTRLSNVTWTVGDSFTLNRQTEQIHCCWYRDPSEIINSVTDAFQNGAPYTKLPVFSGLIKHVMFSNI